MLVLQVLCNVGFMRQLVLYAKDNTLLDECPDKVKAPKFGSRYDRFRVHSATLPTISIL